MLLGSTDVCKFWDSQVKANGVNSSCHNPVMWLKKRNSERSSRGTLKCSSPTKNGTIPGKISRRLCPMCSEPTGFGLESSRDISLEALQLPVKCPDTDLAFFSRWWLNKTSGAASCPKSCSSATHRKWLTGDTASFSLSLLAHWLRSRQVCICLRGFTVIDVYPVPGHVALVILFSTGTFLDSSKNCHYHYYCWSCAPWGFIKESSRHVFNLFPL